MAFTPGKAGIYTLFTPRFRPPLLLVYHTFHCSTFYEIFVGKYAANAEPLK